ncbi:DUF1302 domain-containing protein [Herminiimonas arsenitoxidans]|uniref:DUF1302 domain-containing protein n=1 Tax=Herminiimonas arsenitoxidans TaxID=1809410 RepID=UPI000970D3E8|nr:DUF1302 family protein [Herminiimonas arsenitoxidans]
MATKNKTSSKRYKTILASSITMAFAASIATPVLAAIIETDNPDVELRWDNSFRYTGGWRAGKINPAFLNNPAYDETEGRFGRGDMVSNRLDVLSELDFVYKNNFGFRVSAALWGDGAYNKRSFPNPALTAQGINGNYKDNTYNGYTKRYVAGPSGEILDAFVFGSIDIASTPVKFKLGQHNVYWGESLYSATNSIAYSQGPIDTIKAATSPGAEAKELFLPLTQLSAQVQLTSELSAAAQYAFDWKPYRLVPGGTFFASGDGSRSDYAANFPGGFNIPNGPDLGPDRKRGDFGLSMRWSPSWLSGSAGLYYRKFTEKLPWAMTQVAPAPAVRLVYARDTELYGFSMIKNIGTLNVGSEISYRKNSALNSAAGYPVMPANGSNPTYAESEGARGDTMHALVNVVTLLQRNSLWTGGSVQAEINYSRLLKVTSNPQLYYGEGYASCLGLSKSDGCSTKDAWGMNLGFTPEWPQAMAGWDLSMPTSLGYQIKGNGPALGGGNEGSLSWSIGLTGKYLARHEFSLKYAEARSRYNTDPATGVVTTTNGSNAVQSNHNWIFFTYKTSM